MALALLWLLGSGCQTTIGNHLGDRAPEFGECFRSQTSVGPGLGVSVFAENPVTPERSEAATD